MARITVEVQEKGIKEADKSLDNLGKTGKQTDNQMANLSKSFKTAAAGAAAVTAAVYVGVNAFTNLRDQMKQTVSAAEDFSSSMDENVRATFLSLGEEFNALEARQDKALANMLSGTTQFVYDVTLKWTEFQETLANTFGSGSTDVLITKEIREEFAQLYPDLAKLQSDWQRASKRQRQTWSEEQKKELEYANSLLYAEAKSHQDSIYGLVDANFRDQIELENLNFARSLMSREEYNSKRLELQIGMLKRDIALAESDDARAALEVRLNIMLDLQKQHNQQIVQDQIDTANKLAMQKDQENADAMMALKTSHEEATAEWQKYYTGISTIEAEENRKRIEMAEENMLILNSSIQNAGNALSSSLSSGFTSLIDGSKEAKEVALDVVTSVTSSIIKSMTDVLVQRLITDNITKALGIQATTSDVARGVSMASLNAFASTAAIPVVGPGLAPAAAAGAASAASALGAPAIAAAGARMQGGQVTGGMGYEIGERGREMFIPNSSGRIVSNSQLNQMGNGGNSNMTVNVYNETGASVEATENETGGVDIYVRKDELAGLIGNESANPDSQLNRSQDRLYTRQRA